MAAADRNILPLTFDDTATTNYGSVAQFTSKVAPKNVNVSQQGVPSGDVVFELSTGVNTFLDLYKTYISMRYRCTAEANSTVYVPSMLLLRSMFLSAVVRLNGKIISQSNNYTADSIVSARLSGGESYNKQNNGFYEIKDMANDATGVEEAGSLTSIDRLDALWLRTPEGLVIPPNNKITFVFTIDDNYRKKAIFKTTQAAGVGGALIIDDFNIHPTYYVNESEAKRFNTLRFCNIKSFLSSTKSNAAYLQYTVSPQIMKAVVAHYAPGYNTIKDTTGEDPNVITGSRKFDTAYLFNGGTNLKTLQFRLGNISVPVSSYNFSHGYREAYEDYLKDTNQLLKDSAKESYAVWSGTQAGSVRNNWGKIIVGNITKPAEDLQNNLEIQMTYAADQPEGTMIYIGSVEEQLVMFHESANGFSMEVAK